MNSFKSVIVGLVLGVMVFPANAAWICWTEFGAGNQRSNLDGTNIQLLVTAELWNCEGIALDVRGGKMYWNDTGTGGGIDDGRILRANLGGADVEVLVTGLYKPYAIALDLRAGKMYWTDGSSSAMRIQRANLDGTEVVEIWTAPDISGQPRGLALDVCAGTMYWTETNGTIQRANLDGTGDVETLVTGLSYPYHLALDLRMGKMYWAERSAHAIRRANLDGSDVEDLVTGLNAPCGIALDLDNGAMYWTDRDAGKIQKAELDGSGVQDVVTGLLQPYGIALDLRCRVPGDCNGDGHVDFDDIDCFVATLSGG